MKNSIIIILLSLVILSCNEQPKQVKISETDITGTKNSLFSADINTNNWQANNAYYIEENERIVISALNSKQEIFMFNISVNELDTFRFDFDENTATLTIDGEYYKADSGFVVITDNSNNTLKGVFEFRAKHNTDSTKFIEIKNGNFDKIALQTADFAKQVNFTVNKSMEVDGENGTVKNEDIDAEISYTGQKFIIKNNTNTNLSKEWTIQDFEKNGISILFKVKEADINSIIIDGSNNNQTTVWYKNGKTITYFALIDNNSNKSKE